MDPQSTAIIEILTSIKWNLLLLNCLLLVLFLRAMIQITMMLRKSLKDYHGRFKDRVGDLIDQGQLDKALALTKERLARKPNDWEAHWFLSQIYLHLAIMPRQ